MFEKCQAVIINKIDSMPAFDFDMDRVKDNIAMRNPEAVVFLFLQEQEKEWMHGVSGLKTMQHNI